MIVRFPEVSYFPKKEGVFGVFGVFGVIVRDLGLVLWLVKYCTFLTFLA